MANQERSSCVAVTVLAQETYIETLFNNGVALYGAAIIAACFVAVAGVLHFKRKREGPQSQVGQLSTAETIMKSILPGASFGSEVFLIAGELEDATLIASVTLAFRLLHFVAGLLIVSTLFCGAGAFFDPLLPSWRSSHLIDRYDEKFSLANLPLVTAITLMSLFDVTMVQFLPWKQSIFFEKSKGYPTLLLLKVCMTVKIVQSVASVAAQISYLATTSTFVSTTASPLARGMIIFNVIVAILGALLGLLLFVVKRNLLTMVAIAEDVRLDKVDGAAINGDAPMPGLTDIFPSSGEGMNGDGLVVPASMTTNPMHVLKLETALRDKTAQIERQQLRIVELERQQGEQQQQWETPNSEGEVSPGLHSATEEEEAI